MSLRFTSYPYHTLPILHWNNFLFVKIWNYFVLWTDMLVLKSRCPFRSQGPSSWYLPLCNTTFRKIFSFQWIWTISNHCLDSSHIQWCSSTYNTPDKCTLIDLIASNEMQHYAHLSNKQIRNNMHYQKYPKHLWHYKTFNSQVFFLLLPPK